MPGANPGLPGPKNKWPGSPGGALFGEGFCARDFPRNQAPAHTGAFSFQGVCEGVVLGGVSLKKICTSCKKLRTFSEQLFASGV